MPMERDRSHTGAGADFRADSVAGDLVYLLEREEILGTGLAGAAADDELGVELPAGGDVPLGGDALVDEGVVVLERRAKALGLESGPDDVLEDALFATDRISDRL